MPLQQTVLTTLQALERELHNYQSRHSQARLEELLHPAFHEFGWSGAAYNREQILARLPAEADPLNIHAQNFCLHELSDSIYVLAYQSAHVAADGKLVRHSNRSSIWQLTESGWQMRFHHGSACPPFEML